MCRSACGYVCIYYHVLLDEASVDVETQPGLLLTGGRGDHVLADLMHNSTRRGGSLQSWGHHDDGASFLGDVKGLPVWSLAAERQLRSIWRAVSMSWSP